MRVLLVCESFSPKLSGGKVVRFLYKVLKSNGHSVEVAVTGPTDSGELANDASSEHVHLLAPPNRVHRFYSLLNREDVPEQLKALTDRFQPEVAHFASFDHTKSANLYDFFKSRRVRIVLQPWTMHFYCAQGFGYQHDRLCNRCIDDSLMSAFSNGCTGLRGSLGQLERSALRRSAPAAADAILSSNRDLDAILVDYGFAASRIFRFPIAFDAMSVAPVPVRNGDYYVYYGQTVAHKGIDFLIDLFSSLPEKRLKVFPMAPFRPSRPVPSNIEILSGFGWTNGLREAIADAKAVLIPSLWATSTEYSLCEAMTMKKPVVAFERGAHHELLVNRVNAMVVAPHDAPAFARALDALESDQDLYHRLAVGGAARIAEVNEPSRLHTQLMSAYRPEPVL